MKWHIEIFSSWIHQIHKYTGYNAGYDHYVVKPQRCSDTVPNSEQTNVKRKTHVIGEVQIVQFFNVFVGAFAADLSCNRLDTQ